MAALVIVGSVAACGLYSSHDDETDLPPRADDDAGPDVTAPPPRPPPSEAGPDARPTTCDPAAKFTTVAPVDEVDSPGAEDQVHLATDELTMYVTRSGSVAVFTRTAIGAQWTGGAALVGASGDHGGARVTDDLLRLYYDVWLGGGINSNRVILASRSTTTSDFNGGGLDLGGIDGQGDHTPFYLPDEKTLWFSSTRDGGEHLFIARKGTNGAWNVGAAPIARTTGEQRVVVSADQHLVYFSRLGANGHWTIERGVAGVDGAFDASADMATTPVAELASDGDTYPAWLSPDLCRLYFTSSRASGKGGPDVYLASRSP